MSRSDIGREPSTTLLGQLPRVAPRSIRAASDLQRRCADLADQGDGFGPTGPGPRWLWQAARSLAEVAAPWEVQIGPPGDERAYELLVRSPAIEVWLIHWPSGGRLQLHDHGGASGALRVVSGQLRETYVDARCRLSERQLRVGQGIAFGPTYVHDVANSEDAGATSIHVYAPPSDRMFFYRHEGPGQLRRVGEAPFEDRDAAAPRQSGAVTARIDAHLDEVRRGLRRVDPAQAEQIVAAGGLLVDTRPSELRHRDGEIPGALVVDRNVLEWRLDPSSPHRHPAVAAGGADRPVVLFCDEGYASSLAAASLRAIGVRDATDLIGGFQAWRDSGRPVIPVPITSVEEASDG